MSFNNSGAYTWSAVRCLHTPDSLYRADFFAEYLKTKEWNSNHDYGQYQHRRQSAGGGGSGRGEADHFLDWDGKRYISCAVSSWSGHTYIVHVLIHDPKDRAAELPIGIENSSKQSADAVKSSPRNARAYTRRDEVIYCFDSRLLFAGGASRIFCCASYRGTPSLIFINVDNSIRVAADLRRQLKKFKEPKLALEYVPVSSGRQGHDSD